MTSIADTYRMTPAAMIPVGAHTKNSTLSSVVPLAPPATATMLLIQALTQNVRYTLDNSAPAAATGFVIKAGDAPMIIDIGQGMTVKVIEETASATINYQWGR